MRSKAKKIGLAILIVLVVVGVLAGIKTMQIRKLMAMGAGFAPPPESVGSAIVKSENWQDTLQAIGSVTAAQGVTISPEIAGTVKEIAFESGALAKKGDLLVKLDVSSEEAQLRAVEAQLDLAEINLARVRELRSSELVSQSELDSAEATVKQFRGNADSIRATIEKKTLRAPFNGQLGIRQVNLGQYVDVGKPIVSLQSLSPIYAEFTLPQQELAKLKVGMDVHLHTDTYPGKLFEGRLTAIDPDLDASTRSVRLQATYENAEQLLRPGMFARIEVLLPSINEVMVVPLTAILRNPYGDSVYVFQPKPADVKGDAPYVVRQQFVKTGRTRGDFVTIETGVTNGQKVVRAGVFKLRNGTPVVENNEVIPKTEASPSPANS
jgi:membrane fusion protein (multidrug efflux system)